MQYLMNQRVAVAVCQQYTPRTFITAQVAKLADALASGASGVTPMEVQVLSCALPLNVIVASHYDVFLRAALVRIGQIVTLVLLSS